MKQKWQSFQQWRMSGGIQKDLWLLYIAWIPSDSNSAKKPLLVTSSMFSQALQNQKSPSWHKSKADHGSGALWNKDCLMSVRYIMTMDGLSKTHPVSLICLEKIGAGCLIFKKMCEYTTRRANGFYRFNKLVSYNCRFMWMNDCTFAWGNALYRYRTTWWRNLLPQLSLFFRIPSCTLKISADSQQASFKAQMCRKQAPKAYPLQGIHIADIGCGAGLLSEVLSLMFYIIVFYVPKGCKTQTRPLNWLN